MQGYSFTEDVRRALGSAALEAHQRGSAHVAPEHLLLGLLAGTGDAVDDLLTQLHVSAETIRGELDAHLSKATPTDPATDLPYTRPAKRALERAIGEALALGHGSVDTDHLLLAACAAPGPGQQVLLAHGLTIEGMRNALREAHGSRPTQGLLSRMLARLFQKLRHGSQAS